MSADRAASAQDSLLVSYLTLRKAIGCIGIALPFALALGDFLIFGEGIQTSISAYYHTKVGDVLVGGLCAIGVFLLSYKGYERQDGVFGSLACGFAVGTALFPTSPKDATSTAWLVVGAVHWTCAAAFLGTLAYFSLFLFTKTSKVPGHRPTPRKLTRNKVYRTCGWAMIACLVLILAYKLLPAGPEAALKRYDPVYWLEAAAIVAFGISWLVKGEAILQDELTVPAGGGP